MPLTNTTQVDQETLDALLETAKSSPELVARFPLLPRVKRLKLENAVGLRVELDAPQVGLVEAIIRLEVDEGG
jgi:hypothetical protein